MERGFNKSFCPSEVARRLDPENWRSIMRAVRNTALELDTIKITQAGIPVGAEDIKGPIRLSLAKPSSSKEPK